MNRKLFIINLLGCLFLFNSILNPQTDNVFSNQLGVSRGLSHNSGLCFVQDVRGFLWIGTQNGLSRYDGYNFKNYLDNPGDSTSLSDNYINSLFIDNLGIIWVGTNQGGLNKFNRFNDTFTSYQNNPDDPFSLGAGAVYSINEDKFGNLWVAVNPNGLYLFDRKTERFYHFPNNPDDKLSYYGKRAFYLFKDSKDDLWIGSDEGLNKMIYFEDTLVANKFKLTNSKFIEEHKTFDGKLLYFVHWTKEKSTPNSLISNEVLYITENISNLGSEYWIGTCGGISRLRFDDNDNPNFKNITKISGIKLNQTPLCVWSLFIDREENVWIGNVGNGLLRLNPSTGQSIIYQNDPANSNDFSGFTVRYIFKDNSDVIYFGTENNGINKFVSQQKQFNLYKHETSDPYSLTHDNVTSVFEDSKGTLWVGTKHGGLNRSDKSDRIYGKFSHYVHDPENDRSISHNNIRCIYEDRFGTLWVGSWNIDGGLNRYDPSTDSFTRYQNDPANPNSLGDNQVRAIHEDKSGTFWIGLTETGLDKFDRVKEEFKHYKHDPSNPESLSDNAVMSLYVDRNGTLWIPTFNGGLNKYNPETDNFTSYMYDPSNSFSISHNRVWSVYEDKAGRFWVGTAGGINLFNRKKEEYIHFTEDDGLIDNSVYGILEDEHGNLWLSTESGLSKCIIESTEDFYSTTVYFINYGDDDNLLNPEFNSSAFIKDANGIIYFGGVNGLTWFYPDSIKNNSHVPPVVITSFKIFEKEAELDTVISEKKRIELSYKENFISFEFAALDFQAPDKNQYAYMLEGLNNRWIKSGTRRYVSFSNLEPGKYRFRVKGSNNDGLWNEEGAAVQIIINPPFWMTVWFRILSGSLLLVSFVLLIRFISTQKLKKKLRAAEIQQKLQGERERISRELHDSIGANLTSIITGLEISKRFSEKNDKESLDENISTLEVHTRKTIEELRQTIWSLHQDISCITELAEKVKDHFRGKIKDVKINIDTNFDTEIEISSLESLNLFRIIQEAVNNSIKYSECSLINICFESKDEMIKVSIKDNGKGFDVNDILFKKHSYGIENMKKRTSRINAEFKISSEPGKGTKITVLKKLTGV
jgi:signal transduction histidine kinase/ligand-binding sensor domain-containing protein